MRYQKMNVKQWNCSSGCGCQATRQRETQGNQRQKNSPLCKIISETATMLQFSPDHNIYAMKTHRYPMADL
jgi:hypothetical protein